MTNEPAVYTAHDISDLINTLPTLFGFRPSESIIGIATHGPRHRFGFRLRVDIPAPEHHDELAKLVVTHVENQQAEGAIFLVMSSDQHAAAELLDAVMNRCGDLDVIVAARADGQHYWTSGAASPGPGVAYEQSDHHVSIVQAVASGQQILPDRAALEARFAPVTGERRRWMYRATTEVFSKVAPIVLRASDDVEPVEAGIRAVRPIIDRALDGTLPTDGDAITFGVWVSTEGVHDEVWSLITHDTAGRMLDLLIAVARCVVPPFEAGALSLAAYAAWLTGDGAQSLIAVERALQADPECRTARRMLDLLEHGVSPFGRSETRETA